MPRLTSTRVLAALLLSSVLGCAGRRAIPSLPTTLEERGLLVARLYVLGMQAMEDASIDIDGDLKSSALVDGYIAIPLPPGDHTLRKVRAAGHLLSGRLVEEEAPVRLAGGGGHVPTYIYMPGPSQVISYTTLSVERPFHIEAGRVTNLGLIVYLPVQDPPGTKRAANNDARDFNVINVDNGAETSTFLETNYPELMGKLADKRIILAPARYLDLARLPDLRRAIAYHESKGPRVVSSQTRALIYGRAGTLVAVSAGKTEAAPQVVEVLDTGTLADVVGGVHHGDRFTFVTSDGKLLSWEGGPVVQAPLPYRLQPVGLYRVGERGLMVIDNRLRILSTPAAGEPWADYQAAMVRTPRSDVSVATDVAGAYIALGEKGLPSDMYYLKAGEAAPTPIDAPQGDPDNPAEGRFYMFARPTGLFVLYNTPTFLFRSKVTRRWYRHTLPEKACKPMRVDEQGDEITVECGGTTYKSGNSGATWRRPEA